MKMNTLGVGFQQSNPQDHGCALPDVPGLAPRRPHHLCLHQPGHPCRTDGHPARHHSTLLLRDATVTCDDLHMTFAVRGGGGLARLHDHDNDKSQILWTSYVNEP